MEAGGTGDSSPAPPSEHKLASGRTKPSGLPVTESSYDLPLFPESGSTPSDSITEDNVLEELLEVLKKITWDVIIDLIKGIIEDKIDEFLKPIRRFCRRNRILSGFMVLSGIMLIIPIVLFFMLITLVFVLGLIIAVLITVIGGLALILVLVVMVVILVIMGTLIAGLDALIRKCLCCFPDEDEESEQTHLMN